MWRRDSARASALALPVLLALACGLDTEGLSQPETPGKSGGAGSGGLKSAGGGSAGTGSAGASGSAAAGGASGSAGSGGAFAGSAGDGGSAAVAGGAGTAGSAGTGGASMPTCAEQYGGGLLGVNQVCGLEADECKLAIDNDPNDSDPGQPCLDICQSVGGECLRVYDEIGDQCTPNLADQRACTTSTMSTAVCFCSLGCGGKPPCDGGNVCKLGQCVPA